jgi:hypothetical protein
MKQQIISGSVAILVLAAAAYSGTENKQDESPLNDIQVMIRIRDYAQADRSVRQYSEHVAGEILQRAGVDARWIECPVGSPSSGACASPVSTLVLVVNLLPRSMSDRLHRPGGVLGVAIEASDGKFGCSASVFYDEVKEQATEHELNFGELLGDVIAHELGHLLLGINSHSNAGLMSAFWSGNKLRIASQGLLTFTAAQAKRINVAMTARALAAADAKGRDRPANEAAEEQIARGK